MKANKLLNEERNYFHIPNIVGEHHLQRLMEMVFLKMVK